MDRREIGFMRERGEAALNVVGGLCVLLVVGVIVAPMFTKARKSGGGLPNCQSQMNQIGKAIKTYLSDWDVTYPTNRPFVSNGKMGPISSVKLGKPGIHPTTGKPLKSTTGICWVEGMYPYMERIVAQDDSQSVWKCHAAYGGRYEPASRSAAVSYVMNRNLVEKREDVVRYPSNLMLLRETDRLVDSDLRPINDSCDKSHGPISAFLTDRDLRFGVTNPELHGLGSHILFADGHIKLFTKTQLPNKCKWDPKTKAWTNADGSIMVSP